MIGTALRRLTCSSMWRTLIWISSLSAVGLGPLAALSETIVAKRVSEMRRLVPLEKITVGPYDQYDASISPDSYLVFTHKADLVSYLQIMDTKSGHVRDLLPLHADSQEPSFSPKGRLAFTYYKFNARGDICYSRLSKPPMSAIPESNVRCLPRDDARAGAQRSNPFWMNEDEIGYLERDLSTQHAKIIVEHVKTGRKTTLAEGDIWSPALGGDGRVLAYNELVRDRNNVQRQLKVLDLKSKRAHPLHLNLPGLSGFPAVSRDGRVLYFSHYLNDTNSDQKIDAGDNGVVFRIELPEDLSRLGDPEIQPEQLTSAETNCSLPEVSDSKLYVTCAFEGSLDIYEIPLTGVIPADWTEPQIQNAYQTSRSYQERILLLNALKYRGNREGGHRSFDKDKLFSNHILAGDTVAALYYLEELKRSARTSDLSYWNLMETYLKALTLKKAQPAGSVSRQFRESVLHLEKEVSRIRGEDQLSHIVKGALRVFIGEPRVAEGHYKKIGFQKQARPLERYLQHELAKGLFEPLLPKTLPQMTESFQRMLKAPEFSDETRIYYAVSLLQMIQDHEKSLVKRRALISKINKGLSPQLTSLFGSESAALKILLEPDDAAKARAYRELDPFFSETRGDYFLKKAIYTRTIRTFAEADDDKHLALVASNWLKYTARDSTELVYAREVFGDSSLDQAYQHVAKGQHVYAGNFFYGALTLTDDLESHAGYIRSMVAQGATSKIRERYEDLRKRQFIDDNMKFVEAMLALIEGEKRASEDSSYVRHLDTAIESLSRMSADRDNPVRHLLLGFCFMEKLIRQSHGLEIDTELLQKSHRSLMLAYDLGRDHDRIKASALMNLGILHVHAGNNGLAARFFTLRKPLGFTTEEERIHFEGIYAKSLSRSQQADRAAREIGPLEPSTTSSPFLERRAFYSMAAGRYDEAVSLYEELFRSLSPRTDDVSMAKIHLAYGFSLYKTDHYDLARKNLHEAVQRAKRFPIQRKNKTRIMDLHPNRLLLISYGLLSRMGPNPARLEALQNRIEILSRSKDLVDSWLPQMIQAHMKCAELQAASNPSQARASMMEALNRLTEYADSESLVGGTGFKALSNLLAFGLLLPSESSQLPSRQIHALVTKSLTDHSSQKVNQPILDYQALKIQVLWTGYQGRVHGKTEHVPGDLDSVLASELGQKVKTTLPEKWREIETLAHELKNTGS